MRLGLLILLAALAAAPAAAQDGRRWFLSQHAGPGAPRFDGPYPNAQECEATRATVLQQNRDFVAREAAKPNQVVYVARLRQQLAAFEGGLICELR